VDNFRLYPTTSKIIDMKNIKLIAIFICMIASISVYAGKDKKKIARERTAKKMRNISRGEQKHVKYWSDLKRKTDNQKKRIKRRMR